MLFQGLKLKKQRSTGDIDQRGVRGPGRPMPGVRSNTSTTSWMSSESGYGNGTGASIVSEGSNQSFMMEVKNIKGKKDLFL